MIASLKELYIFKAAGSEEFSYRVSDEWLRVNKSASKDILQLSSLVVRLGSIGSLQMYKVLEIQRTQAQTSFIRKLPGGEYLQLVETIDKENIEKLLLSI